MKVEIDFWTGMNPKNGSLRAPFQMSIIPIFNSINIYQTSKIRRDSLDSAPVHPRESIRRHGDQGTFPSNGAATDGSPK